MNSGPTNNIPKVVATVPAMMRTAFGRSQLRCANARQPNPTASRTTPAPANRCAGLGGDGRPDSAATIDDRAADRAGHHAATTAVTTARTIAAAIAHHCRWKRSTRWLTRLSKRGASAIHVREAQDRSGHGADDADDRSVGDHREADLPVGRAERAEHAQRPEPALRHDGETGGGDEADEQEPDGLQREHDHRDGGLAQRSSGSRCSTVPPVGRNASTCLPEASNRIVT